MVSQVYWGWVVLWTERVLKREGYSEGGIVRCCEVVWIASYFWKNEAKTYKGSTKDIKKTRWNIEGIRKLHPSSGVLPKLPLDWRNSGRRGKHGGINNPREHGIGIL